MDCVAPVAVLIQVPTPTVPTPTTKRKMPIAFKFMASMTSEVTPNVQSAVASNLEVRLLIKTPPAAERQNSPAGETHDTTEP
jgi:hypothetical protein